MIKNISEGGDDMAFFEGFAEVHTQKLDANVELKRYEEIFNNNNEENKKQEIKRDTSDERKAWDNRNIDKRLAVLELRELGSIGMSLSEIADWAEAAFAKYRQIVEQG